MLGFTDMSTLVGHFVSSPREREKRDSSRRDEREGQGRKTGMKVKKLRKQVLTYHTNCLHWRQFA